MKTVTLIELKKIDDVLKKSGMQVLQTVKVKLGVASTFQPSATGSKPGAKPGPKPKATVKQATKKDEVKKDAAAISA